MTPRRLLLALLTILTLAPRAARSEEDLAGSGEVRVPLAAYAALVGRDARPARAGYALGAATVAVVVKDDDGRVSAAVRVDVTVRVFDGAWTLVPLLPAGTAVTSATSAEGPIELVAAPSGLAWATDRAGSHRLTLAYTIDAARSEAAGFSLALPVPAAASTELTATLPGTGLAVSVVPSTGARTTEEGATTKLGATVPATAAVQITWRTPGGERAATSRARYTGELRGDSVAWTALLAVDVFAAGAVTLPVFPASVTLAGLEVDGKEATVLVADDAFHTVVSGRGTHQVKLSFTTPVIRGDGPPRVDLHVPRIPVSRFDLTLPGKKAVTVKPGAGVTLAASGTSTLATVFVPMADAVSFAWSEAVPEAAKSEVRANATVIHAVRAEEGVLQVHATVEWEITRGETSALEMEVPADVQVDRVTAPSGAVSDWRLAPGGPGKPQKLTVYLDRKATGTLTLEVECERPLRATGAKSEPVSVPVLHALGVERQRGIIALLAGVELTLAPADEKNLTRVGENQLPAAIREGIKATVAHTYKYGADAPVLTVRAVPPERKKGVFDAEVDLLVSIAEATMRGHATVGVRVKTGSLLGLELRLPDGVNVLALTGPSLRSWGPARLEDGVQKVAVDFTQELDGQFALDLVWEKVLREGAAEAVVPTLSVADAEVEHGRIAVEALAAVEVQAAAADQLSSVETTELPQQLVLETTNPILLAYKYVQATTPWRLALKVTRHPEVDVQVATIDRAQYHTLFTRDGLSVTRAVLAVRNSRKQFLRLALPADAQVWSVLVDGRPEKPAQGKGDILVKLLNSSTGFPVEIVYATRIPALGMIGSVTARLPRPDLVVTHTRWDVYLPAELRWRHPRTNLETVEGATPVDGLSERMADVAKAAASQGPAALPLTVPARGLHLAFEKLYANQSADEPFVRIGYVSPGGDRAAAGATLAGTALAWAGLLALAGLPIPLARRPARLCAAAGAVLVAASWLGLGASLTPALLVSAVVLAGLVVRAARERLGGTERPSDHPTPEPRPATT